MQAPTFVELRRGVLAVSVLHDVDVDLGQHGVRLPGTPCVSISWTECRRALAGTDPESEVGRERLAGWLLARRWAADAGREHLALALRPVGLPVDHALHPGLDWVRVRVMGDALDLGLGAAGLDPADPDRVVLLPVPALDAAGIDPAAVWVPAARELERLGTLAAERLRQDPRGQLRPLGDCDVVTLLGSRSLRAALADAAGGMAAVVVPMRRRGWTRLALIDPAFGAAAAAATSAADRGFPRPLLLTADELTVVPEGGRPEAIPLRDPAADAPWQRDVLYR
ncbi:MAG TPA: hypothetical protein VM433_04385 [Mycobacteriales bacterium]|nr:hypothetical protein [Mycobacteriales bacterium]